MFIYSLLLSHPIKFRCNFLAATAVVPKPIKQSSTKSPGLLLAQIVDKGLVFQNWITWDKRDGLASAKRKYVNGQETIPSSFFKILMLYFQDLCCLYPYESANDLLMLESKKFELDVYKDHIIGINFLYIIFRN